MDDGVYRPGVGTDTCKDQETDQRIEWIQFKVTIHRSASGWQLLNLRVNPAGNLLGYFRVIKVAVQFVWICALLPLPECINSPVNVRDAL